MLPATGSLKRIINGSFTRPKTKKRRKSRDPAPKAHLGRDFFHFLPRIQSHCAQ